MLRIKTKQHTHIQSKHVANHIFPENINLDLAFTIKNVGLTINKLQEISSI
jgi:hypothetical protein